jgi:aminopeptidase N
VAKEIRIIFIILSFLLSGIVYSQGRCLTTNHSCSCSHALISSPARDYELSPLLDLYDVNFYKLDLRLEKDSVFVSGYVKINAKVKDKPIDTLAIELIDILTVDSVLVNGKPSILNHEKDLIKILPDGGLDIEEFFSFIVFYHGYPPNNGFYTGLNNAHFKYWDENVTWTFSEPFSAYQWWPCKQDLEDKADSAHIFITTSAGSMAGSNGILTARIPLPGNRIRYEWKTRYPIAYYLISAAVANYQDYSIYAKPASINDSVLVQNFIFNSQECLSFYKDDIDKTVEFLELFSDLYGIYPFYKEKYGHCLANMWGGMEHQTMSTMGNFNFALTAHELAHHWFGNNVTCRTWSDIWVNEGFATYSEYLAYQYLDSQIMANNWLRGVRSVVMSEPDGSVYIPPEDISTLTPERIFDGRLSYKKGALLLHMIRFELQDDTTFFNVFKEYQNTFSDSTATGLDFMKVLEDVSGKDFSVFFDQWYFGEGYPEYTIRWKQKGDSLFFTSSQQSTSETTPLFKMTVKYDLRYSDGTDTSILVYQNENYQEFNIPVNKTVTQMIFDPDLDIIAKGKIIKIIEDSDNLYFTLSPVPCSDYINIDFSPLYEPSMRKISVFNAIGQKVSESESADMIIRINTYSLESGLYFVRVESGDAAASRKFVRR